MRMPLLCVLVLAAASIVLAQSTPAPTATPTSQPATPKQMLSDMLRPTNDNARPLQPLTDVQPPLTDPVTGTVAPGFAPLPAMREGSYLVDRVGRLTRSGERAVFTLESDGRPMQDPPLTVLANLKLMLMEDQLKDTNRDLRFRVTGLVTEYRGKNFVLLDKVVVLGN